MSSRIFLDYIQAHVILQPSLSLAVDLFSFLGVYTILVTSANFAKVSHLIFPAAKVRQFNIFVHTEHVAIAVTSLLCPLTTMFPPSMNHCVPSTTYHVPSTYREQPECSFQKESAQLLLNKRSSEPTDPSVTAAVVEHSESGINISFPSASMLTSPTSVAAAGPTTVSESQTVPRKRLKLSPLTGWGVQRNGVAMSAADYAQKDRDEFNGVSGNSAPMQMNMDQCYSMATLVFASIQYGHGVTEMLN
ncbi:hypothetical protein K438DRAFT_1750385 [Mycena galopus ATCC 62051]|nr:hypothetical protein K438DRAFT_1750385 [Mycena galopus ATCC 62051]